MPRSYKLEPRRGGLELDLSGALNPAQLKAVTAGPGAWLIIAGAGTGKTRTLTYRVASLIQQGVSPDGILLCTFTNKAAREMLDRVADLAGADVGRVWGGTFHHVANRLLRAHGAGLGLDSGFGIMDRDDSLSLLENCLEAETGEVARRSMLARPAVLLSLLGLSTNLLLPLEQVIEQNAPDLVPSSEFLLAVARRYRARKQEMNLVDFDDLLFFLYRLLEEHEDLAREISAGFEHVLVDEYQDCSLVQVRIVDALARVNGNLSVVGDDAQSIYSFRGADPDHMLDFTDRWPEARTIKLEENYRSTPQVLDLANDSIARNRRQVPKRLLAHGDEGPLPARIPVHDVQMQADFVAQRVLELKEEEGVALAEMAVLYRAHHHSMELQVELTRRGIPFTVRSGLRFFEQAHIKDVLAFLRVWDNPADQISWMRILKLQPGIGRKGAERIIQTLAGRTNTFSALQDPAFLAALPARSRNGFAAVAKLLVGLEGPSASLAIERVLEKGYEALLPRLYPNPENRAEDLRQLAAYSARFAGVREFLTELNLMASFTAEEVFDSEAPDDALVLSSIHQAKGLEWDAVFVLWLNEGQVPHARSARESRGLEEERRLFYVAVTRTRELLHLLHCQVDHRPRASQVLLRPSRFLQELDPDRMELWNIELGAN